MRLRCILFPVLLLLTCGKLAAQPVNDTSSYPRRFNLVCATPTPKYFIYEINGTYYAYAKHANAIRINPRLVREGKRYFRLRFAMPWSTVHRVPKRVFKATIKKPYRGDAHQWYDRIDTFVHKGIKLKRPVEVIGTNTNGTEETPTIISSFQFVKRCNKNPSKHFEIVTK